MHQCFCKIPVEINLLMYLVQLLSLCGCHKTERKFNLNRYFIKTGISYIAHLWIKNSPLFISSSRCVQSRCVQGPNPEVCSSFIQVCARFLSRDAQRVHHIQDLCLSVLNLKTIFIYLAERTLFCFMDTA